MYIALAIIIFVSVHYMRITANEVTKIFLLIICVAAILTGLVLMSTI